jgi:acyl-CoA dehydrogenase
LQKKELAVPDFHRIPDIVAPYLLKYGTEDQKQKYHPNGQREMITAIDRAELWK